MADGAFFIMAIMLLVLLLSAAGSAVVAILAAILAGNSKPRSMTLLILLVGGVGMLLTDILVFIARMNPSASDHLPRAAQILLIPFDWSFISSAPAFAFISASLFGFAWAGSAAALVALVIVLKRKVSGK